MKHTVLQLIKLANKLDELGYKSAASEVDKLINNITRSDTGMQYNEESLIKLIGYAQRDAKAAYNYAKKYQERYPNIVNLTKLFIYSLPADLTIIDKLTTSTVNGLKNDLQIIKEGLNALYKFDPEIGRALGLAYWRINNVLNLMQKAPIMPDEPEQPTEETPNDSTIPDEQLDNIADEL